MEAVSCNDASNLREMADPPLSAVCGEEACFVFMSMKGC